MASEYLLKKYKDVKPDEVRVLTKEEKRKNWWHYHRIHVLIGVIVLAFVASFVWEMGSKVEPDYQLAYVGTYSLPLGSEESIEELLEAKLEDRNGDNKVSVQVNSFVINEQDPNAYAVQVSLVGDITLGSSSVFLVADPMEMQQTYGIFYQEDGTLPTEEQDIQSCENCSWELCSIGQELDLGMDLYLIHRGFFDDEMKAENAGVEALWEVLTERAAE